MAGARLRPLPAAFARAAWSALLLVAVPCSASAEEAAAGGAEAAPAGPWSFTAGLYSQYISRGVSYSAEKPVVQGSAQYTTPGGWYLGLWGSNVSRDFIHDGTLETDPYGGYTFTAADIAWDLGFWRWTFVGASLPQSHQKYDTIELYAGATWRWLNLKYWQEVTDYFGLNQLSAASDWGAQPAGSSRGSHYLEGNVNLDLGHGNQLLLHAGRQEVRNYGAFAFSDWRIGVDHDLGSGWTFSLGYSDTTANPHAYVDSDGLNAARGKLMAALHAAF